MRHPGLVLLTVLLAGAFLGTPDDRRGAAGPPGSLAAVSTVATPALDTAVRTAGVADGDDPAGPAPLRPGPALTPVRAALALVTARDQGPSTVIEPVSDWDGLAAVAPAVRVATVTADGVAAFDRPGAGAGSTWFANPAELGGPRVFLVLSEVPGFVEVLLPVRPNGTTGWVSTDDVTLGTVTTRVEVSLGERRLTARDGPRLIAETPVVVGAPVSPTPTGTFFLRARLDRDDPGGGYGPTILALSGFSEALETFKGGQPVIAIHGTNHPELVGQARSNGCIRVPNDVVADLADRLPLGTPVIITP